MKFCPFLHLYLYPLKQEHVDNLILHLAALVRGCELPSVVVCREIPYTESSIESGRGAPQCELD